MRRSSRRSSGHLKSCSTDLAIVLTEGSTWTRGLTTFAPSSSLTFAKRKVATDEYSARAEQPEATERRRAREERLVLAGAKLQPGG